MPFGKMDARNLIINKMAALIGRTPSALAMKMVNFASLDPAITGSGRSGLGNASNADRAVWNEFHADWDALAVESQAAVEQFAKGTVPELIEDGEVTEGKDYTGETRSVQIEQRVRQNFFRKAVLSNYDGRCCVTGLKEPRLLLASHIVPWSRDKGNRLNPHNGLCLSALHDRAFDLGFITVRPDLRIRVSREMHSLLDNPFAKSSLIEIEGREILRSVKFHPDPAFLDWHGREVFRP
jgi:predicted restriction endonuclease